ncbi:addiction module protein [bacterium]|nr:addiction module protein [bacterium]
MEASKELLKKALELKPAERIMLLSGLIESLDEPDKTIDEIWTIEAEKRLKAYRNGKLKGVSYSDVFGE